MGIHKDSVYITAMDENGIVTEQYEIENMDDEWNKFKGEYLSLKPEIAMERSSSGKYVARLFMDMVFSIHIADPAKFSLIFNTSKKNDRGDSYKLAKHLRLNELPEVHLPSKESDSLRSLVRYRNSLGEETTMLKNRIHAVLSRYGIHIKKSDIFGRKGLKEIEKEKGRLNPCLRRQMKQRKQKRNWKFKRP